METIPEGERIFFATLLFIPPIETISAYLAIILLLVCSALISGSEVAFFSMKKPQLTELEASDLPADKLILTLLTRRQHLLATILIANNFVNIGIIILSSFRLDKALMNANIPAWSIFLINVVFVTFILVLFGEIAPKVYANLNNLKVARLMARPLKILNVILNIDNRNAQALTLRANIPLEDKNYEEIERI